ncbi:hypothetical protein E2562_015352 [Oryza meyeriana var. granulata]|uniref:Uncharacterized protein n=1 Tax=Oryza meyeriana var. granulata TaxID=110450 RepID=A0A6G1EK53_9ORYZ|nr:hypothetical protein E2562_015352 [Oryza meyeriana var. granulata]
MSEMDEFFNLNHLHRLLEEGNWDDALRYVLRFIPHTKPDSISIQANTLFRFLHMHRFYAKIVAGDIKDDSGTQRAADHYMFYLGHGSALSHAELRLRCITLSVLSDTVRASTDWEKVRRVAAERVHILVERTPELKRHILYNKWYLLMPHQVLPIEFSFRQRRHVKKRGRRPSKHALARVFHYIKENRLFFPSDSDGPSVGIVLALPNIL